MKLKYGIVSAASIAPRFIKAIKLVGDDVYAIASNSKKKANELASQFGITKIFDSYEQMYQDQEIDIVYIPINNANHAEQIKLALSYKKHVVVEKPIALSQNEAIWLFEYAKQQNCFLMEAQKSVFLPITQTVKELINKKRLGTLKHVSINCSFESPVSEWMFDPKQGGIIYDVANYPLEYLDYLLEPKSITVQAMGILNEKGTCDQASLNLTMGNVLVNINISSIVALDNKAVFYFDKGSIVVPNHWKAQEFFINENGTTTKHQSAFESEMYFQVKHINECISNKKINSEIMTPQRSIRCASIVDIALKQVQQL